MGKKNRRRPSKRDRQAAANSQTRPANNGIEGLLPVLADSELLENYLNPFLRNANKKELDVDDVFVEHKHAMSTCDGAGQFVLMSNFTFWTEQPHLPRTILACTCLSTHKHFQSAQIFKGVFHHNLQWETIFGLVATASEAKYVQVPFRVCSQIIGDCLLRMKKSKNVLHSSSEKAVVRLYGLRNSKGSWNEVLWPNPAPAPSMDALWCLLNRSEYARWGLTVSRFSDNADPPVYPNLDLVKKTLRRLCNTDRVGEIIKSNVAHMALYHSLDNQPKEGSWLLWEAKALETGLQGESVADYLETSAVVQILLNRSFLCRVQPKFQGMTPAQASVLKDMNGIPKGIFIWATIAPDTGRGESVKLKRSSPLNLWKVARQLKKAGCAVCGSKKTAAGEPLLECSRCRCTVYCCRDHQRLHWKSGHKKRCEVYTDPKTSMLQIYGGKPLPNLASLLSSARNNN